MNLEKANKIYTTVALLFFNTVLIFVMLNVCALIYGLFDQDAMASPQDPIPDGNPLTVYEFGPLSAGFDVNHQVHYDMEDADLLRMMLETWNLFQICDEGILFREEPFNGRFVHVDEAGFRRGDVQGPWPPDDDAFNVFVLGGSTTFGYGVQDNLTIPADLQFYLRESLGSDQINVYNFGRAAYFSVLEAELFRVLLRDGFVPDLAIFIDGLNEFQFFDGQPPSENCVDRNPTLDRWNSTLICDPDEVCLPLQVLATNLVGRPEELEFHPGRTGYAIDSDPTPADDEPTNRAVIQNWLDHKQEIEAMAAEHEVPLLFVIQPVPGYAYDLQYHLFADQSTIDSNQGVIARTHYGYPIWMEMIDDPAADWTGDVLNLARLSEDNEGPIYVDGVHYTFGFSEEIAQAIRDTVVERGLINLSAE